MATQPTPFDQIAEAYDACFSDIPTGRFQRDLVWRHLPSPAPGATALELNCGTGVDAVHLARMGYSVLATDVSSAMVRRTQKKAESMGLEGKISTQVINIQSIASQNNPISLTRFDLIFSDFGGLNCLSPQEVTQLISTLPRLIKPGGCFIAVVMGRFCWWEMLYFMLKGRPKSAFRRLSARPVMASLASDSVIQTWYHAPGLLTKPRPGSLYPIGFFLPPSYLDPFFRKRPRFLQFLNRLDVHFQPSVLAHASDHYLIKIRF
jgi:ubiquinone/menaquinone biosynthesis C-methylase UbiE